MKLSMKWLCDYIHYTGTVKDFIDGMTMSGSKAESFEKEGAGIDKVVIGRILSIEPHPDADKLVVCQIDVAAQEPLQIVTAAKNVVKGALVPVCLSGGSLPDGTKIKSGKLRGVKSDGMMCGLSELGLTKNDFPYAIEDGIFLIEEDCSPGDSLQETIGLCDTVVDFEITSNRPDCLSVLGLAREASATFSIPFTPPKLNTLPTPIEKTEDFSVSVESSLCPTYLAKRVKNVSIAPSPRWMRERLRACGVRPINNLVDITNYVMLEYGRPMHAFDAAVLRGNEIHVRTTQAGEEITTLDGNVRQLPEGALIIADSERPVAVAGVMGGENSEITENTTEVVLESACFDGSTVRTTAKALNLRTESSARFEKGLRPDGCDEPLERACQLIKELGAGEPVDVLYGVKNDEKVYTAPFDPDWINSFLNISLSREEMEKILISLDFLVEGDKVIVPNHRTDISNKADVAEEIARIYGYNNISSTIGSGASKSAGRTKKQIGKKKIDAILQSVGCFECYSYSFIGQKDYDALYLTQDDKKRNSVKIKNPLGEDTALLRTTLIPSIVSHLSHNYKNRNSKAWLYEISRTFTPKGEDEQPEEKNVVTVGLYGDCDFYTIKGIAQTLIGKEFDKCEVVAISEQPFHSGRAAKIIYGNKTVGILGELHPNVLAAFDIKVRAYVAEFDLDSLLDLCQREITFKHLPKFPSTSRDFSVLCDKELPAAKVREAIVQGAGSLFESIHLFDVYEGERIPQDKKSLSFNITLRDNTQTITDQKADKASAKIVKNLELIGAHLRDS